MKRYLFSISLAILLALGLWWGLPTQKALAATCTWTGSVSNAWANAANWSNCGGNPPQATDSVLIPFLSGPGSYPTITSSVTIVDITIDNQASLTVGVGGSLTIKGNFVCNGTYTATKRSTIFSGTANQTVSGAGTTTFGRITINNSGAAGNNIVEIMPTTFNADAAFLILTDGILKLSGSYTLSNSLFSASGYSIAASAGIWLNNPNVTISAAPFVANPSILNGSLQITAGAYVLGESLEYNTGSSLTIDGGDLSVGGWFAGNSGSSSSINFTMSAGTFTVATTSGLNLGTSIFSILGPTSNVTMSGGTIIIQNENIGTGHDFSLSPGGSINIFDGTVQFGNNSTSGASPSFELYNAILPSMVIVSNGTNAPSVVLYSGGTVLGNVTIGANTTLDTNGYFLIVSGNATVPGDWTNNGTLTDSVGAGGINFNGAAGQTIGGANPTTFDYLYDYNTSASGVMLANNATVSGDLYVSPASLLYMSTFDITVAGSVFNDGVIRQIKVVDGTTDIPFFSTGGYGGVIINANGTALGLTTVTIWGNHDCTVHVSETVRRCFYIDPANTSGTNATITFFFASSELVGTNVCSTLNVFHFNGGTNWGTPLNLDTTYGVGGRDCVSTPESLRVTGVSVFSPFVLRSRGAPTVINLRNLTAQSNARISVALLAAALGFLFVSGGLLYLRRHKVQ